MAPERVGKTPTEAFGHHRFAGRVDSADSAKCIGRRRRDARQAAPPLSPSSIGPSAQGPGAGPGCWNALRSIYRQLASALHPDREPDPVGRAQER